MSSSSSCHPARDDTLDIEWGKLKLFMDDLDKYLHGISIPMVISCEGIRRKKLNMINRAKDFSCVEP